MHKVGVASNGRLQHFMLHYCYPLSYHWKVVFDFYIKWCENGYSGSMLFRCATVSYPSTKRSKYSNCAVYPSKYGKNKEIHVHHHRQACLIHYFGQEQIQLLTQVIQCRIRVRSGYFINWVRPTWPGQNMNRLTRITQMTWPGFNPIVHTYISFEQLPLKLHL